MRIRRCRTKQRAMAGLRPDRRNLAIVLLSGVALLLLTSGYLWLLGGTVPAPLASIGGPFTLTATNGEVVTDRNFRGRYLLIYFGYSHCQDVCPTTLGTLRRARNTLGPRAAQVQPLFVTVDPEHDTPAVMREYLAAFSPRLIGLTGTSRQLRAMQREYKVISLAHPSGLNAPGPDIDHSSVLYLVDPNGRYLAPIRADESADEMAGDLGKYLS